MRALRPQAKFVVSLSGPSKSGKTITVRRIFGQDLIEISGSNLPHAAALWERVLDWMETPSSVSRTLGDQTGLRGGIRAGFVTAEASLGTSGATTETYIRNPFDQVIREIGESEYVIFVDDFHYITREVQADLSRQIKAAMEAGVKIVTASVPHRSEDLLRANPELRGRLTNIDITYWNEKDLRQIANKGFRALGVSVPEATIKRLANEACGSPQLMQAVCQFFCWQLDVTATLDPPRAFNPTEDDISSILDRTTVKCNFGDLTSKLHSGPKTRGTERKIFSFKDGSKGDVYRAVLLGMSTGNPTLSIRYDEMMDRINAVCVDEKPVGSAVTEACKQSARIADAVSPGARILDWDDDYDTLNMSDPYFLFYLRCSPRIRQLQQQ